MIRFFAVALLLLLPVSAQAEEFLYAPDDCEFAIVFPEEPYTAQRCDPENPDKCSKITSYTKVFGMAATVHFNVTCNPVTENMYDRYSGDIMRATLMAMAASNHLEHMETHYNEVDGAKNAILLGAGSTGSSEMIYSTHLWIGKKSVFTVEAELIGDQPPEEAEALFTDILRSINLKKNKEKAAEEQEKTSKDEKEPAVSEEPEADTLKDDAGDEATPPPES
ncbi:MAG: hypothetical protein H6868_06230 [Rhodospirillales bacterium]|nr:hypothetical protein [Rhodospirillales bacterium]